MIEPSSTGRGRPKTINRDQVVNAALRQYWRDGPTHVSINDICKEVATSKPAIYREFGNDDGLKLAALRAYRVMAIDPFLKLFQSGSTFDEMVLAVVDFLMQDREALGLPKGCLFVTMRALPDHFGAATTQELSELRRIFLATISKWVEVQKRNGSLRQEFTTATATHHIDALHTGAMRMQKEQVNDAEIQDFLRSGFVMLTEHNKRK